MTMMNLSITKICVGRRLSLRLIRWELLCAALSKLNLSQALQFVFQKTCFPNFNYPPSVLFYIQYWEESANFFFQFQLSCKLGFCVLSICCRDDGISNEGKNLLFRTLQHYFPFTFPLWLQKKLVTSRHD